MQLIAENDKVLQLISLGHSLLDGTIQAISIAAISGQLVVDFTIKLLSSKSQSKVVLRFSGVHEYTFDWSKGYSFYFIEDYTLVKHDNLYYLSLDPYRANNISSEYDNDCVRAESISLFEIAY